ncbi:DoxX family membrane protein [Rathayibacter sp. VKM Ac-2835]|uniref:DoxX family membrane protein n=1 Tax=Rathayibacter sp. VKM Ac-2835 TaxID=2739043 RepID=UPI001567C21B|nr:DoxX family membrane protein [Rathayibacter sp. VKM Ac-2835]NRG42056.1 DoxX family membrane protein [Rathayibacter sp. VKM Ac-2835]
MTLPRTIARVLLGLVLVLTGTGHLTFARQSFQAQVPPWLPFDPDVVVLASGVVEIALGLALLLVRRRRVLVGIVVAAFFVAVFPGNVAQLVTRTPAFGLETDAARAIRLVFQPLLVLWALWCTGVLAAWNARRRRPRE